MNTTGEHKTRSSGKNINAFSFFVNHNYLTLFCRIEISRCRGECEFSFVLFIIHICSSQYLSPIVLEWRKRIQGKSRIWGCVAPSRVWWIIRSNHHECFNSRLSLPRRSPNSENVSPWWRLLLSRCVSQLLWSGNQNARQPQKKKDKWYKHTGWMLSQTWKPHGCNWALLVCS